MKSLSRILCRAVLFLAFSLVCSCTSEKKSGIPTAIDITEAEKRDVKSLVSDLKIIELEYKSDSPLGFLRDFRIVNDRIYCFDIERGGAVLVFTLEGRFLFKIHSVGQAKNEWISLSSMFVNGKEKTIYLTDRMTRKVLCYDLDGKFLKSYDLNGCPTGEVGGYGGHLYAVTSPAYSDFKLDDRTRFKLEVFSEDVQKEKAMVNVKANDICLPQSSYSQLRFTADNDLLLVPICDDTVYGVENGEARPYVQFSGTAGLSFMTDEELTERSAKRNFAMDKEKVFWGNGFVDDNRLVYRRIDGFSATDVLYDKKGQKTILTHFSDISQASKHFNPDVLYVAPYCSYDGRYYANLELFCLGAPDEYVQDYMPEELKPYARKYKEGKLNGLIVTYKIDF